MLSKMGENILSRRTSISEEGPPLTDVRQSPPRAPAGDCLGRCWCCPRRPPSPWHPESQREPTTSRSGSRVTISLSSAHTELPLDLIQTGKVLLRQATCPIPPGQVDALCWVEGSFEEDLGVFVLASPTRLQSGPICLLKLGLMQIVSTAACCSFAPLCDQFFAPFPFARRVAHPTDSRPLTLVSALHMLSCP